MSENSMETSKEVIEDLELQLKIEKMKHDLLADSLKCGVWVYDIATKKYTQSRKLDGKWSNKRLDVENYRETMKSWGLIHPEDLKVFEEYCDSMDRGDDKFEYDVRSASDEGRFIWLRFIGNAFYDKNGKAIKIVGLTLDVTKQKTAYSNLDNRTMLDPLTHLYNETTVRKMIENLIAEDKEKKGILYIIDIDNFRKIDEQWGHIYGDQVIERLADSILAFFNSDAIIGRIGGDEFIIFCCTDVERQQASITADKLMERVSEIDLIDGSFLTVSVGISIYPEYGSTYDSLYNNADIALYYAKRSGKNKYYIYNKRMSKRSVLGETTRKKDTNRKDIPKEMTIIEKELFDYAFETISAVSNFQEALQLILSEIGIHYKLDSIFVLEYFDGVENVAITGSWIRKPEQVNSDTVEQIYTKYWKRVETYFCQNNSLIYDITDIDPRVNRYLYKNGIQAAIQIPIFDGNRLLGLISYESREEIREWSPTQIATLSSITKMISSYMLRMRLKTELEDEFIYTGGAMDSLKLTYYSIDYESYELLYVSRYSKALFPNIQVGDKCYQSLMGLDQPCKDCPLNGLQENQKQNSIEIYDEKRDAWFTVSASVIESTMKKQYLICWMDITMFLERVKSTDQLTGTLSYDKFCAESLKKLSYKEPGSRYATAFIGIRNFESVNENCGYMVGDIILQTIARHCTEALQEDELICRIKGDDFILLLRYSDIQIVKSRISKIFESFHKAVREMYPYMALRCDCGIYEIKATDYSISGILDKSNLARKQALGNAYEWDSIIILTEESERLEIEEKVLERLMLEALRKKEYQVYLQPKVNVRNRRIMGAEALVRWWENGKMISPAKFIPIAEKSGIVTEIDKQVYDALFQQIKQWLKNGYCVPVISFNVSRLHLYDDNFVDYMKSLVDKYEIPYELLEIELTESVFFNNADRMKDMITRLRSLGFKISMDDFGTGYSTLSLMKSLPMDVLKIDGNFFYNNQLDRNSKAIISAIIQLSKNLGVKVVAEGIETIDQVIFIQEEDCDYAQGYYYYKPLPMKEFEELFFKEDTSNNI